MGMNYRQPEKVLSPKDAVKKVTILYNGGEESISVAKIEWNNKEVMGFRWNVAMREWDDPEKINGKECLGMPVSTGHPVWFIIPDELLDKNSDLWKEIDSAINKNIDK